MSDWKSKTEALKGMNAELATHHAEKILAEHRDEILAEFRTSAGYISYARAVATGRARILQGKATLTGDTRFTRD